MTSEEFLTEVLRSPFCPQDFENVYREFQIFQNDTRATLDELHHVCEANGIEYQLAYGTLLGLIRDGGQIPWDYDTDVFVAYEDKYRLIEALKRDLDDSFYFYCPETNPKCRHEIMRIAPKGYRTEALHVDVFYYVGSPEGQAERMEYQQKLAHVSELRFGKLVNVWEESLGEPRRFASLVLKKKMPAAFRSLAKIQREYEELCGRYSADDSTYLVSADSFAGWYEIPSTWLRETELTEVDGRQYRIPIHYDQLLQLIYGDYMSVPPLEGRIREVMRSYSRIKFFGTLRKHV